MLEVRVEAGSEKSAGSDDTEGLDPGATSDDARAAGGALARRLSRETTVLDATGVTGEMITAFTEGVVLGGYRYKQTAKAQPEARLVEMIGADAGAVERGLVRASATAWARDLTNTPTSDKTPAWLGAQAVERLTPLGVEVTVRDDAWLAEQGFGGVLAVGGAAAAKPRLIHATWRPRGAAAAPHVVLVGKGITFDTGGLNRKSAANMRLMHTDMGGGAAVLGALDLVARAELPIRVTVLVPTAENAIGGASMRPGDVIRHYGGRTSEVLNTDAEGRLVLADALAYALARLKPSVLIDVATLTGAAKVALGLHLGGLFATDDALAEGLLAAGARSGERLWRLPLLPEYESSLRSDVADANNSPGNPGAITAALFLKHFVGDVAWAHLDIAGPGRAPADDGIYTKGATGFGARLLASYVESCV